LPPISPKHCRVKLPNSGKGKPQWDDFRFVEAVARRGSLNQAAAELGVEQTTVNYRISRLEEAIGKPLFSRSRRGAQPTLPGQRIAEAVSEAAAIFQRAMDQARATRASQGEVKIATPEGIASLWLSRFLPWFAKRYERVAITISPYDPLGDDKTTRYDSVIQLIQPSMQDVICTRVGTLHYLPYASETYLKKHGRPRVRRDLLEHRLIDLSAFVVTLGDWARWVGDERIRQNRVMTTDFTGTFVAAIRGGVGIGLLPTYVSAIFPDVVALDVGLNLPGLGVWHVYRERSVHGRPNPAAALIKQAFDENRMPWFSETYVPPDDFYRRGRALEIPL
jgi:DNA-binding transcriptional LysR family regulator